MSGPDRYDAVRTAERVARESYGRLVAFLSARTRDIAGAEDALAEAFASALRTWPGTGVPQNPDAWLLTAARRRQTDAARRRKTQRGGEEHLQLMRDGIDRYGPVREGVYAMTGYEGTEAHAARLGHAAPAPTEDQP